MYVMISTTNKCNAKCTFCFRANKNAFTVKQGVMYWEIFEKIVKENPGNIFNLSIFGEPLCDPMIVERVKFIRSLYPESEIYFHTNGQLLTTEKCDELSKAGLSRIVISCYGLMEQHDRLQPGTKFEHIAEMGKYMASKMPVLIVSNVVEPMNNEVITKFWRERGCSVIFDTALEWGDGKKIPGKLSGYSSCAIAMGTRLFHWTGGIATCCYDFNMRNSFANIGDGKYKGLLVKMKGKKFDFCENCPYREIFENFRSKYV